MRRGMAILMIMLFGITFIVPVFTQGSPSSFISPDNTINPVSGLPMGNPVPDIPDVSGDTWSIVEEGPRVTQFMLG